MSTKTKHIKSLQFQINLDIFCNLDWPWLSTSSPSQKWKEFWKTLCNPQKSGWIVYLDLFCTPTPPCPALVILFKISCIEFPFVSSSFFRWPKFNCSNKFLSDANHCYSVTQKSKLSVFKHDANVKARGISGTFVWQDISGGTEQSIESLPRVPPNLSQQSIHKSIHRVCTGVYCTRVYRLYTIEPTTAEYCRV